ncbi:MAG: hypothetical protein ICV64_08010 [Thermoleophilia bacterium]|nr:hypothetical protein [Thermoleophilia bacterium]
MAEHSRLGTAREHETEALVAELIERLELHDARAARLEHELELLRTQRDLLETELEHATGVVAQLTKQLIEVEGKLAEQPLSLKTRIARRSIT